MLAKGILGDSNPTSLNYTIFYAISQQFGNREHQEHHQIHIEDQKIVKRLELVDQEYMEWVEGLTKIRQGFNYEEDWSTLPHSTSALQRQKCLVLTSPSWNQQN